MELKTAEERREYGYYPADEAKRPMLDRNQVLETNKKYWIVRRGQDILFSSLAILVLWPLVLICAVLIMIDSPGAGPFFVQERVGRENVQIYKEEKDGWK